MLNDIDDTTNKVIKENENEGNKNNNGEENKNLNNNGHYIHKEVIKSIYRDNNSDLFEIKEVIEHFEPNDNNENENDNNNIFDEMEENIEYNPSENVKKYYLNQPLQKYEAANLLSLINNIFNPIQNPQQEQNTKLNHFTRSHNNQNNDQKNQINNQTLKNQQINPPLNREENVTQEEIEKNDNFINMLDINPQDIIFYKINELLEKCYSYDSNVKMTTKTDSIGKISQDIEKVMQDIFKAAKEEVDKKEDREERKSEMNLKSQIENKKRISLLINYKNKIIQEQNEQRKKLEKKYKNISEFYLKQKEKKKNIIITQRKKREEKALSNIYKRIFNKNKESISGLKDSKLSKKTESD